MGGENVLNNMFCVPQGAAVAAGVLRVAEEEGAARAVVAEEIEGARMEEEPTAVVRMTRFQARTGILGAPPPSAARTAGPRAFSRRLRRRTRASPIPFLSRITSFTAAALACCRKASCSTTDDWASWLELV